jgi:hypothetical protein
MRFQLKFLPVILVVLCAMPCFSQAGVEFSADSVESHPKYGDRTGRLFMGHNRIRTDFEINGEKIIQIIDLDKQQATIVNVALKSFMRRQAGRTDMKNSADSSGNMNPCANMQNLDCKDAGSEMVNGRRTHKWVITGAGQTDTMTFWLDEQRKIPVRQVMPDGSLMELRMLGSETVNGRSTEKWEMSSRSPNGESQQSTQWYDPELNINVREEQPGVFTRNLINIKLGKQPDDVFSVPPGFTEQSTPQQLGQ